MTPLRQRMLEELQRHNYSQATIESYIFSVKEFAEYFHKSPALLGAGEVRRYHLYLINEKKLAAKTVKVRMSALRFFYWKTLKRRDLYFDDLPLPKTPKRLPAVLSPEEIVRLIRAASSLMHHTILILLYATGIRRAELRWLKVSDIDSQRMVIHIQQGKGRRDRDVPMTRQPCRRADLRIHRYRVGSRSRSLGQHRANSTRGGPSDMRSRLKIETRSIWPGYLRQAGEMQERLWQRVRLLQALKTEAGKCIPWSTYYGSGSRIT
jgi:site-specific recombinase XerD